jgi:hypothetical protein
MKVNARILFFAHMVYLYPKHIRLLAAFTQLLNTHIQIEGAIPLYLLGNPPWRDRILSTLVSGCW